MKGLLITIVVVVLLALIDWVAFSNSDSTTTITIDRQKVQEDTLEVVD